MSFDIILDMVVITCLAATIAFAVRLNKKLSTIYKSREDLQEFLNQFTASMEKADAGVKDLKGIGESVFKAAQDQMKIAQVLKDDLAFLNERGEDLAGRLDSSISIARQLHKDLGDNAGGGGSSRTAALSSVQTRNEDGEPDLVRHLQNVR